MKTLCSGLFLIIFFSCAGILSAQKNVIDSLKSALQQHSGEDMVRAKILLRLAYEEYNVDYAAFKSRVLELEQLTNKIGDTYWLAQAWRQKSEVYIHEGELDSAYQILNDALALSQTYRTSKWLDLCYDIQLNLAGLFHETNPHLAFKYLDEALATLKSSQKMERACALYGNKAILYTDIGQLDSAEVNYKISMDCSLSNGDSFMFVQCLRLYSDVLLEKGNIKSAIQNYLLASTFYEHEGMIVKKTPTLFGLAKAYLLLKDYRQSQKYIHMLDSMKFEEGKTALSLYELKYQWFEATGQHDSTVYYLKQIIHQQNQIHQNEKKSNLESYETKFRLKQQELKNLAYKVQSDQVYFRNTILSIIVIITFIIIFFLVAYQWHIRNINKRLNKAYEEMSALVVSRQFLTNLLAHDLRSPLHVILLKTAILSKLQPDNQLLKDIIQSSSIIQQKTSRIAEIQTISPFKIIEEIKKIEIQEILDKTISNLIPFAKEKQITFNTTYHTNPSLYIFTNSELLSYILDNLINNAIKYSPDGSEILVDTHEENPETVNIFIKDEGPGIAHSKIINIYQHPKTNFFRSKDGWKIGLGLTQYFVEQLEGWMKITTHRKSRGTTIKLTFPKVNSRFQMHG